MFQKIRISPSFLSADFLDLGREVAAIEQAGADWVHYDVMDGHFVPNLSVGVPVLKQLRAATSLPLDVHLMISNPLEQLPWFLECNPDHVTVHWEAFAEGSELEQAQEIVDLVRSAGACPGLAIKPDTPVGVLDSVIELWDMFLVMSVFPGFSGQSFIRETPERVRQLAEIAENRLCKPLIQVDGGIGPQTAPLVSSFGADVLVAGNAVFKAQDYQGAVEEIRNAATEAAHRARGPHAV